MDTQTPTSFAPRHDAQRPPDLPPSTGTKKKADSRRTTTVLLVLVTLIGALGGAVVVARAGDRVDVLAVARDVEVGKPITDQDLKVVSFAEDPGLSPILATDRADVVGKRASVELRKGGLLTQGQLTAAGGLGDDAQVVGVELKRGFAPRDELRPGDRVAAIVLPPQGSDSSAGEAAEKGSDAAPPIEGTVKSVGAPDATGAMVVNLVVDPAEGPELATKAAAKRIALIRQPREES